MLAIPNLDQREISATSKNFPLRNFQKNRIFSQRWPSDQGLGMRPTNIRDAEKLLVPTSPATQKFPPFWLIFIPKSPCQISVPLFKDQILPPEFC